MLQVLAATLSEMPSASPQKNYYHKVYGTQGRDSYQREHQPVRSMVLEGSMITLGEFNLLGSGLVS